MGRTSSTAIDLFNAQVEKALRYGKGRLKNCPASDLFLMRKAMEAVFAHQYKKALNIISHKVSCTEDIPDCVFNAIEKMAASEKLIKRCLKNPAITVSGLPQAPGPVKPPVPNRPSPVA